MAERLPPMLYIRQDVTAGQSANASYRRYQEASRAEGLRGIRRATYLQLYSETRYARGRMADAIQAPRNVPPAPELQAKRTIQRGKPFGSWVMMYFRERGTGQITPEPWLMASNELLTPEEAESRAGVAVVSNQNYPEREIVGIGYAGTDVYQRGDIWGDT